ncbi:hypothetical protein SGPA1_40138 [Streptomyces misionensis JCM 4497]
MAGGWFLLPGDLGAANAADRRGAPLDTGTGRRRSGSRRNPPGGAGPTSAEAMGLPGAPGTTRLCDGVTDDGVHESTR